MDNVPENRPGLLRDPGTGMVIGILLFQQLLGGLTFPIARYGLQEIEPFTFAFYRFVISSLVLLAIVRARHYERAVDKKDYWKIVGLGVLVIPFNQTAYLYGQKLTAAGHGALLFATVPIWMFVLALIHLKEQFHLRRLVGVIVGLTGVAVVMAAGAINISRDYLVGDLVILFAVFAWAYYTILGKPLVRRYGATRITAYALASGSVLYFPFGLYRAIVFDYSGPTLEAWLTVLYVALGVSITVYVLWYWVLKHMEASRVAVFHNVQPITAAAAAYLFLNEPMGWPFIVGGAIVLIGVLVTEV